MNWLEALALGFIQGLTEFLPVSSSGHLTIAQTLMGVEFAEGDMLFFDVVVHAATVCSTLVVLWSEVVWLLRGTFTTKAWNPEKQYAGKILLSMVPVFVVGMFFKDKVESVFGSGLMVVGVCLLITAALLTFAQYARTREKEQISWLDSFVIGIAQAIAVLPGLSRSGCTIATGLILGNKKEHVAQFSFLMVLIPILGAAMLDAWDLLKEPVDNGLTFGTLLVGFVAAFLTGCFACKFMINIVKRQKLIYFAIYCFVVGAFSILWSLL